MNASAECPISVPLPDGLTLCEDGLVRPTWASHDRLFGCGTLALQTSADDPLLLRDVPKVEMVQVEISNLIFHDIQGAIDADPTN